MTATEIVIARPQRHASAQTAQMVGQRPGAAVQSRDEVPQGQIEPLDKRRLDLATQPHCLQHFGHD